MSDEDQRHNCGTHGFIYFLNTVSILPRMHLVDRVVWQAGICYPASLPPVDVLHSKELTFLIFPCLTRYFVHVSFLWLPGSGWIKNPKSHQCVLQQ